MDTILEWATPFLHAQGRIILYKIPSAEEKKSIRTITKKLQLVQEGELPYHLAGKDRILYIFTRDPQNNTTIKGKKHKYQKNLLTSSGVLIQCPSFNSIYAGVAQWLESLPSKQAVVGSSPIARSILWRSFPEHEYIFREYSAFGRIAQLVRARL